MLQNGFVQGDRLSMGFSVELRLPFVDYKLIEFMVALRRCGYNSVKSEKGLFVNLVKSYLPDWVFSMPKRGFSTPPSWSKNIYDKYSVLLKDGLLVDKKIINRNFLKNKLLKGYPSNKALQNTVMKCIVLEIWLRKNIGLMN